MPLKMMMMYKKFIITSQISNYILKKSVLRQISLISYNPYKKYNVQLVILIIKNPAFREKIEYLLKFQFFFFPDYRRQSGNYA